VAAHLLRRPLIAALALALAATAAACTSSGDSSGDQAQGVTDDAVSIGYQVVDLGALSDSLGIVTVNQGSYETRVKAIEAVVAYVNANGGLGGRTLQPVIQQYAGPQDAPDYAEAQCRALTQDSQVFAVAMDGQFQNNVRPCFKAANTVMLDQTLLAQDTRSFEDFAPYLFAPTVPEYSAFITTQLQVMGQAGFYNGATGVSVIAPDTEVTRRIVEQVVLPKLQGEYALPNSAVQFVDTSNIGTLGAGSSAALRETQVKGLNRVLVVGGARIEPVLFSDSLFAELDALYAISSFDNPAYFIDNTGSFEPSKRAGMLGLGFMPALDLRKNAEAVFPDPARPNEGLCKQIIDQAGAAPPETFRENYRTMMQFCDSTLLLKAAFDKLPKGSVVNATTFRDAVWSLGSAWTAATVQNQGWPANAYSGVVNGRGMYFDANCQVEGAPTPGCFLYGTPETPLTPQAAIPVETAPAPAPAPSAPVASVPAATPVPAPVG
jgi:hypothetical protein